MHFLIKTTALILLIFGAASSTYAQENSLSEEQVTKQKKQRKGLFKKKKQKADEALVAPKKLEEAEINILFSYYNQDGNRASVTGGLGSEALTDAATLITVNVPLNEKNSLNVAVGVDYYTSASSDKIDRFVSSASVKDVRAYGNVGYTRKKPEKGISYGIKVGGSTEYDYNSLNFGTHFSKTSKDKNRSLSLSAQVFTDSWELIYPEELRGQGRLVPTNKRKSFNGSATFTQVINKRMQVALTAEAVYQQGLLSTPFHRVYFEGQELPKVEQLPSSRVKFPIGLRFNYFVNEHLMTRLFYRYYWDDWGVRGHTFEIEAPIKINRFVSVYPLYRFHTQTGARYFAPYAAHTLDEVFYTSDTDLATMHSHKIGVGVRISPPNGIARMKIPFVQKRNLFTFKGIDLRYGHYIRSTDLRANIVSLGMSFGF